jgi:hypothetical protein
VIGTDIVFDSLCVFTEKIFSVGSVDVDPTFLFKNPRLRQLQAWKTFR